MPEVIRFAKGTASEHLNFTGENGEITLICDDTPNRKVTGVIRLHDGQTVGGIPFGGSQLLNDMHDVSAANTIEFQVMTVDANGQFYFANTVETIADGTISGDKIYGGTISTSAAVFEGSSENAIVRITQTGAGNALVVEDSANPDSTPFVVNASGNVSIGSSTSLSAAFTVVAESNAEAINIRGRTTDNIGEINFWSNDETTRYAKLSARSTYVELRGPDSGSIRFYKFDGTEIMRIDSSGKLSISASDQGIQIGPDIAAYTIKRDANGLLNFRATQTNFNGYIFDTVDGQRMHIDSSGNVGIGTTNPSYPLHISGTGHKRLKIEKTDAGGDADLQISSPNDSTGWILFHDNNSGNNSGVIKYVHSTNKMHFRTNDVDNRLVISDDGNVGVGTSSPSAKLYISGGILSHAFDGGGNWRSLGSYGSGSGTYAHIKTNLSYNSYKMTTFRATGYFPYSSTGHGYLGCYTYGSTPNSPYGQSNLNLGDHPIAHSQYYASDSALVLVFNWPTTYNGFWLEYLSTGGAYGTVTDVNVISYTQSNDTTGVY